MYRLVVYTREGLRRVHPYEDYDTLDYNATFCQFSPNIIKAVGQHFTLLGWETLFTIE